MSGVFAKDAISDIFTHSITSCSLSLWVSAELRQSISKSNGVLWCSHRLERFLGINKFPVKLYFLSLRFNKSYMISSCFRSCLLVFRSQRHAWHCSSVLSHTFLLYSDYFRGVCSQSASISVLWSLDQMATLSIANAGGLHLFHQIQLNCLCLNVTLLYDVLWPSDCHSR